MLRLLLLALLTLPALAQRTPYDRMLESQAQVMGYLKAQANQVTASAADELSSRQSWEAVSEQRRLEMRDMLGLEPPPPKTALNVQITGTIDKGDYVIEKVAFESLPKIYVTANLYIPKSPGPKPTILYVCGHATSPYGAKTQYQRHGHTLAKHGYVAMLIDPIQIAETFALHHGVLNNEMEEWYARGYTPAGLEIWNMIRAMDYLETRPEVDPERFGVTGRSGGAAMSWFSAAVDKRIKAVVPVMGISTYAANLEENTQRLHCDCMFAINSWMQDMLHQGGLIAPRPLLMAHGAKDKLFPVPGYTEFERVMARLYDGYGRHERFRNLVVDTGHADSDSLRAQSVEWFDKFLAHVPARTIDVAYEEVPPAELTVFGGNPPADALNYRAHELFIPPPPEPAFSTLAQWQARRDELLPLLRERVFGAFPKGGAPQVGPSSSPALQGFQALAIQTEPGITVQAQFRGVDGDMPALLWVASDGEDDVAIQDILRQMGSEPANPVMILRPRGVGEVPWPKKVRKDMDRNAMHLGRSVDSMRLWDVLQAVAVLRQKTGGSEVAVAGIGQSAALSLYAGVLDEQIAQVILFDPPSTHVDGPTFLNVLRYTDLPEAAALMAPRRVTFYSRTPQAYQATQGVFTLHGAPDHFALTMSLKGALNGRFDHGYSSGL
ncbi:MAG: acetylxylan esterase [Bryobacterales bacterium]|nr:acetylxylan esterase [Bryobacterales bacterium]